MKSVFVHSTVQHHLDSLPRSSASTGVLLGQSCDNRTYILSAIPTPIDPESNKPWLSNLSWMQSHIEQVARMCIGGITPVGIYLSDHVEIINKAEANGSVRELLYTINGADTDRYLIKCVPKVTCELYTGSKKDNTKSKSIPIKSQQLTQDFTMFSTHIPIDVTLPLISGSASLLGSLKASLKPWESSLAAALVTIDGEQFEESLVIEKLAGGGKKKGKGNKREKKEDEVSEVVEYHVDFHSVLDDLEVAATPDTAIVRIVGTLHSRAFIHNKQPLSVALAELRNDLIRTVHSRFELIAEDAIDQHGAFKLPSNILQASFPRRVYVTDELTHLCDYAVNGESEEEIRARVAELIGTSTFVLDSAETDAKQQPSVVSSTPGSCSQSVPQSKSSAAVPSQGNASSMSTESKTSQTNLLLPLVVLIGAVTMAFMYQLS